MAQHSSQFGPHDYRSVVEKWTLFDLTAWVGKMADPSMKKVVRKLIEKTRVSDGVAFLGLTDDVWRKYIPDTSIREAAKRNLREYASLSLPTGPSWEEIVAEWSPFDLMEWIQSLPTEMRASMSAFGKRSRLDGPKLAAMSESQWIDAIPGDAMRGQIKENLKGYALQGGKGKESGEVEGTESLARAQTYSMPERQTSEGLVKMPGEMRKEKSMGASGPPPSEWACPVCDEVNYGSEQCSICGTPFGKQIVRRSSKSAGRSAMKARAMKEQPVSHDIGNHESPNPDDSGISYPDLKGGSHNPSPMKKGDLSDLEGTDASKWTQIQILQWITGSNFPAKTESHIKALIEGESIQSGAKLLSLSTDIWSKYVTSGMWRRKVINSLGKYVRVEPEPQKSGADPGDFKDNFSSQRGGLPPPQGDAPSRPHDHGSGDEYRTHRSDDRDNPVLAWGYTEIRAWKHELAFPYRIERVFDDFLRDRSIYNGRDLMKIKPLDWEMCFEEAPHWANIVMQSLAEKVASGGGTGGGTGGGKEDLYSKSSSGGMTTSQDTMKGLVGLWNLGNTCCLNAALQALMHVGPFIKACQRVPMDDIQSFYDRPRENAGKKALPNGFLWDWLDFVYISHKGHPQKRHHRLSHFYNRVSPRPIRQRVGAIDPVFLSGQQDDAYNAMNIILDALDEEMAPVQKHQDADKVEFLLKINVNEGARPFTDEDDRRFATRLIESMQVHGSTIKRLFCGVQVEVTRCCDCLKQNRYYRSYRGLTLPLMEPRSQKKLSTIEACTNEYEAIKQLTQKARSYTCFNCNRKPYEFDWMRRVIIAPPVVVFHLDRFGKERQSGWYSTWYGQWYGGDLSQKHKHVVHYEMKIRYYDQTYDLMAIVMHKGRDERSGHYTCRVRSMYTSKWFLINDDEIKLENVPRVVSKDATILVYVRRGWEKDGL